MFQENREGQTQAWAPLHHHSYALTMLALCSQLASCFAHRMAPGCNLKGTRTSLFPVAANHNEPILRSQVKKHGGITDQFGDAFAGVQACIAIQCWAQIAYPQVCSATRAVLGHHEQSGKACAGGNRQELKNAGCLNSWSFVVRCKNVSLHRAHPANPGHWLRSSTPNHGALASCRLYRQAPCMGMPSAQTRINSCGCGIDAITGIIVRSCCHLVRFVYGYPRIHGTGLLAQLFIRVSSFFLAQHRFC
jgi:hypothetical protein